MPRDRTTTGRSSLVHRGSTMDEEDMLSLATTNMVSRDVVPVCVVAMDKVSAPPKAELRQKEHRRPHRPTATTMTAAAATSAPAVTKRLR
ncbi:hypothetical protein X975_21576, partial [Stegodyphus mimosarum]